MGRGRCQRWRENFPEKELCLVKKMELADAAKTRTTDE
jgi:hypothetical protein